MYFCAMEKSKKNKKPATPQTGQLISLAQGQLPPQAIDLEEAVLGAMMIDKTAVDAVIDILEPEVFYKPEHRVIYAAIRQLFTDSKPVDLLTVSEQLRKQGQLDQAGGDYHLIHLSQKVASSAHVEFHARVIQERYMKRKLIEISNSIIKDSYDNTTDVFNVLDEAENELFQLSQGNLKKESEPAETLVDSAIQRIEEISKKEGFSGIPSGFKKIDEITSGWQISDLIIIAARPGMGKTAFVVSMAMNMAIKFDIPVALFSLEMSSVQLITRMISGETGLESDTLRKGKLASYEWTQLYEKVEALKKAPIYIDDTPALSIFDLRAKARKMVSKFGVQILIIDYLQLMTVGESSKAGNREQEISTISRNLKALAKELEIPVIALSQLSRNVERRKEEDKRPVLSDLRESGAIEQDADIVSFIYRPEYYNIFEWDDEDRGDTRNQAEFIIAKHRNGSLARIRLSFEGRLARFTDLETDFTQTFSSKMNPAENILPESATGMTTDHAFGMEPPAQDPPPPNPDEDLPF